MYAVVIGGALVLSALGLADELFNLRSERILAATFYCIGSGLGHLRRRAGAAFDLSSQSGAETAP